MTHSKFHQKTVLAKMSGLLYTGLFSTCVNFAFSHSPSFKSTQSQFCLRNYSVFFHFKLAQIDKGESGENKTGVKISLYTASLLKVTF